MNRDDILGKAEQEIDKAAKSTATGAQRHLQAADMYLRLAEELRRGTPIIRRQLH